MIRRATIEDLPQLLHLGEVSCAELTSETFDLEYAEVYIRGVLSNVDDLPLVLDNHQDIVGFLVGSLIRSNYSRNVQAVECHWYVLPDYRSSLDSLRLLVGLEGWAKAMGALEIVVSSGVNPKLERVLKKMGYGDYTKLLRKGL